MSKREHILDVAEALFNEFGYTSVGVDLIRDKAEVSKTSMYRHFGSKSNLIDEVLRRRHERFEAELNATVSNLSGTEAQLEAILDWHFNWMKSIGFKGCMFMHALSEFKGSDELVAERARHHKVWLKSLLLSIFEPEEQNAIERTEVLMTFLEGVIVRAEFDEVSDEYEMLVRKSAKHLALDV